MENRNSFIKAFPFTWIVTIIVTTLLWVLSSRTFGLSYLLGSATSLMAMSLLYKGSYKVLEQSESNAKKMAIRNYLFRFLLYAIVLIASALLEELNLYLTAGGLFTFKIVLQIILFIEKRGNENA
ncbi:MAG: ATP synthase subunit I [Candidatus Izemoplasmataceae bacterium]